MKKTVILLLALFMLMTSCQKDIPPPNENSKLLLRYILGQDIKTEHLLSEDYLKSDYSNEYQVEFIRGEIKAVNDYLISEIEIIEDKAYFTYELMGDIDYNIDMVLVIEDSEWLLNEIILSTEITYEEDIQISMDNVEEELTFDNDFIYALSTYDFETAETYLSDAFYTENILDKLEIEFSDFMISEMGFLLMDIKSCRYNGPTYFKGDLVNEYFLNEGLNNEEVCYIKSDENGIYYISFKSLEIAKDTKLLSLYRKKDEKSLSDLNISETQIMDEMHYISNYIDQENYIPVYEKMTRLFKEQISLNEFTDYISILKKRYAYMNGEVFYNNYSVSQEYLESQIRYSKSFTRDIETPIYLDDSQNEVMEIYDIWFELDVELNIENIIFTTSQGYKGADLPQTIFDSGMDKVDEMILKRQRADDYITALKANDFEFLWEIEKRHSYLTEEAFKKLLDIQSKLIGGFDGVYAPIIGNERQFVSDRYIAYQNHIEYGFVSRDSLYGSIVIFYSPEFEIIGHHVNLLGGPNEN